MLRSKIIRSMTPQNNEFRSQKWYRNPKQRVRSQKFEKTVFFGLQKIRKLTFSIVPITFQVLFHAQFLHKNLTKIKIEKAALVAVFGNSIQYLFLHLYLYNYVMTVFETVNVCCNSVTFTFCYINICCNF